MGNKLVDPGDALNSFLFKKIQHGMEINLTLTAGENPSTHDTLPALTLVEREMVHQWVLFGAKDTGTFVSEQTISTFYVNQGGQPRIQPLAPLPRVPACSYTGALCLWKAAQSGNTRTSTMCATAALLMLTA